MSTVHGSSVKYNITFDIDGVLARTDRALLEAAQKRGLCLDKTEEDVVCYRFEDCFKDVSRDVVWSILSEPGFYYNIEPSHEVIDALLCCYHDSNFNVHIITARHESNTCQKETKDWLKKYGIKYCNLHFIKAEERGKFIEDNRIDVFIEDRPDTLLRIQDLCKVVAVAMPYNIPKPNHRYLYMPRNMFDYSFNSIAMGLSVPVRRLYIEGYENDR